MPALPQVASPHLTAGNAPRQNKRGPDEGETMHAVRRVCLAALIASPAHATQRTLITDLTGRNCMINQDTELYVQPDLKARVAAKTPELTEVHIIGGKQFGPPIAFPMTDDEFARTWLEVRTPDRKIAWAPSAVVDCGG